MPVPWKGDSVARHEVVPDGRAPLASVPPCGPGETFVAPGPSSAEGRLPAGITYQASEDGCRLEGHRDLVVPGGVKVAYDWSFKSAQAQ